MHTHMYTHLHICTLVIDCHGNLVSHAPIHSRGIGGAICNRLHKHFKVSHVYELIAKDVTSNIPYTHIHIHMHTYTGTPLNRFLMYYSDRDVVRYIVCGRYRQGGHLSEVACFVATPLFRTKATLQCPVRMCSTQKNLSQWPESHVANLFVC